jgi:hypothetical protein
MNSLQRLQDWYFANCDEDWEHAYGISVETLDNPGWTLTIDLTGTSVENKEFKAYEYGMGQDNHEWVHCQVDGRQFKAAGGPHKLEEMIDIFLAWASG